MSITYQQEPQLGVDEYIEVLQGSTLAERRPIEDRQRLQRMLDQADLVITARANGKLVGIAHALTDFSYCTYLSDLAVEQAFQGQGIGRELIRRTHEAAGYDTTLILLAAPKAKTYYPHIGMSPHDSCWIIKRRSPVNEQ